MIDKGRWGKVRMKAMLQLCQFVLKATSTHMLPHLTFDFDKLLKLLVHFAFPKRMPSS